MNAPLIPRSILKHHVATIEAKQRFGGWATDGDVVRD